MSTTETAYRFEQEGGHAVITLLPSLNDVPWADIERIGSDILSKFGASRSPSFVVDLSALNYMGSAMVALIVRLWKSVKDRNGRMVVVCRDEMVLEVLNLAGLTKVWTIVQSRHQALQALGSRGTLIGEESSGGGGWISSIVGLIAVGAAGFGLYALLKNLPQLGTQPALGLLFGGAALGLIFGLVAVLKGSGFPKVLGLIVMMAAVGIGVAGVVKLPELMKKVPVQEGEEEAADEDGELETTEESSTETTAGPAADGPKAGGPKAGGPGVEPGAAGPAPAVDPLARPPVPPGAAGAPPAGSTPPAQPAESSPATSPSPPTPANPASGGAAEAGKS